MTDEELDRALAAYSAPDAPPGFADRVLAAHEANNLPTEVSPNSQVSRTWRRWVGGAAIAGVVAAAALLAWWPPAPQHGALLAEARSTVALGARGVAVVERGAELSWMVDDERAVLEQPRGNVFYRVEPGAPFSVQTPGGAIDVTGTCFRVEVLDMAIHPQLLVGGALGALVAGSVLVTVYEGSVRAQNEHGEVVLDAGEQVILSPGRAPDPPIDDAENRPNESADRASEGALAAADLAAMDIDTLRARLRAESQRSQERAHEIERLRGLLGSGDLNAAANRAHFFPASPSQLTEWAEACQLRLDAPPIMGMEPGHVGQHAETLGLTTEEAEVMQSTIDQLHRDLSQQMRSLYVEATGDTSGAAHLSPSAMLAEIQDKASAEEEYLMTRIARERAGLETAPADLSERSASERAVRLYASMGDEFQRRLAHALGPDRAYALRSHDQGWPWDHSIFSGCPNR